MGTAAMRAACIEGWPKLSKAGIAMPPSAAKNQAPQGARAKIIEHHARYPAPDRLLLVAHVQ